MEISNTEVTAIAERVNEAAEQGVYELNDLQLALIGGGIGEVVFG
jgi:hypothetical protein